MTDARPAPTLMVMGTSSSAGKSLLVAGLCRCFARRGLRVAPFKAQNMSNNAAVCADGAEIGRAQALQALAAGLPPAADMNPILLKPEGDARSQVIVNGRPLASLAARDYYRQRDRLWPHVVAALDRLRATHDVVVIEGAGSAAELNLRDVEIVNFAVARHARSPVILVGDIERGGVFAQLLGTLWLLADEERPLVRGLVVNKFRGDASLFDAGATILEERGGVPVLGVVPWIDGLRLPEEDALGLGERTGEAAPFVEARAARGTRPRPREMGPEGCRGGPLDIAVVRLPHLSNFDDFDPLGFEPGVGLRFVVDVADVGDAAAIILPGTKNTLEDLAWLRRTGLAAEIRRRSDLGCAVVGICGGYQMLGRRIRNPERLESAVVEEEGLGLLDVDTVFRAEKRTVPVSAVVLDDTIAPGSRGQRLSGYEIHVGRSSSSSPWLRRLDDGPAAESIGAFDGCHARGGSVWGCYVHGLFHNDGFRRAWLRSLGWGGHDGPPRSAHEAVEQSLDRVADVLESRLDVSRLLETIDVPSPVATRKPAKVSR